MYVAMPGSLNEVPGVTACCSALLDWLPRSLGIEAQMSRNLENKNEARIIQDISRLIVPSAESLALLNMNHKRLVERRQRRVEQLDPPHQHPSTA